jgi:hypothetical protein
LCAVSELTRSFRMAGPQNPLGNEVDFGVRS